MAPIQHERVDVLVVGGGLAAMQAAVTAREAGASVGVVSKRRMGRSGSSAATSGGFAAVLPENTEDDTADLHYADTVTGSGGIADPDLVRVLVDEAPAMVAGLAAAGGAFLVRDGEYQLSASGDHSRLRSLGAERHLGTSFTIPLAERAIDLGVREFANCMAIELLVESGRVVGILGIDTHDGTPIVVEAHATVLGTGGAGQLYPVSSNPVDVTGDGFSLGARAGARLRDMEFVQFYPWRCIDPFTKSRVSVQPASFTVGAKMYNARGERFMAEYAPDRLEATTRDISAIAIFDQMRRGLGVRGGVRIDFSDVDQDVMEETNPKLMKGLERPGIDYRTYEFIVSPEAHYYMGGLVIDTHAMTTLPGLYAVGECAGGIQGGNRLSNNALPEAAVFGRRAAVHAVESMGGGHTPHADESAAQALAHLHEIRDRIGQTPSAPARARVQQLAFDSIGIIRDAASLEEGQRQMTELEEQLRATAPARAAGLAEYFSVRALVDTANMTVRAARMRTESRAAHYRLDHPERDDEHWLGVITVARTAAGSYALRLSKADVPLAAATKE